MQRGIPEVPLLVTSKIIDRDGRQHIVLRDSPELRRFLVDMRQIVKSLQGSKSIPTIPSNLVATALGFGVIVQWTRSVDADFHQVLWATQPTIINANVVDVGNSAQWTDYIGQSGITRYYWVRAVNSAGRSTELGPAKATTLAAGTGVAPPPPPPPAQQQVTNQQTGGREYFGGRQSGGRGGFQLE